MMAKVAAKGRTTAARSSAPPIGMRAKANPTMSSSRIAAAKRGICRLAVATATNRARRATVLALGSKRWIGLEPRLQRSRTTWRKSEAPVAGYGTAHDQASSVDERDSSESCQDFGCHV